MDYKDGEKADPESGKEVKKKGRNLGEFQMDSLTFSMSPYWGDGQASALVELHL